MSIETPVFESFLEEVTPRILGKVYSEVNESFANYFDMRVEPPFIHQFTWSDQVSEEIKGEMYQYGHIILYPRWQETGENRSDMRIGVAHEMGHALYRQLITYLFPYFRPMLPRRGYATSADEAFANLTSIVDQGEGNPDKVTKLLKPHIMDTSLLFSPDRITRYPKESDYFKDPAFLHYIYQQGGLKKLMKFLIAVPSTNYEANSTLASIQEIIIGKRRGREYFRRYYSLLNKLFGIDSDSLSRSANNWYAYAVTLGV